MKSPMEAPTGHDDARRATLGREELPAPPEQLAAALIHWFQGAARELPWRTDRTPYRVWLSEIMLQQTRVATVIDYFERFTHRFPTVQDLAAAPLDDVLGMWSGLGYYARGRNLHRAAQTVVADFGGLFPATVEELRGLPGVGPYTAGAIASLAFGVAAPIVDGNVLRVLTRLCDDDTPIDTPTGKRAAEARATALVQATVTPAHLNEGLMELGALVCTPKSPSCAPCPWRSSCVSHRHGTMLARPVKQPKRARKTIRFACCVIIDGAFVWLERRAENGLFGGLYAPPSHELSPSSDPYLWFERMLRERGLPCPSHWPPRIQVNRTLTHRDLIFDVLPIRLSRGSYDSPHWKRFGTDGQIGLSSAVRSIVAAAQTALGTVTD